MTAVVTSRSLKWHLVPFRDFWSENSEKWSLFCLKSPFSNDLVPFSKFWIAKKCNWHFYHRYANCWFWFYWQPMKPMSSLVDLWSKVRCVCRTNPRGKVWQLAYTAVFRSLFSALVVPIWSFFREILVPFWSLLGNFFRQGPKLSVLVYYRDQTS